jgi:hypothetical protein
MYYEFNVASVDREERQYHQQIGPVAINVWPGASTGMLSVRRRFTASHVCRELPLIAAVADALGAELRRGEPASTATLPVPQARPQGASRLRLVGPARYGWLT